jgi:hypothetical protein
MRHATSSYSTDVPIAVTTGIGSVLDGLRHALRAELGSVRAVIGFLHRVLEGRFRLRGLASLGALP